MRESAVRGPAVDFEEFERRLRVGPGRPVDRVSLAPEPPTTEKVDPLEELARIIRSGRVGAPLPAGERTPAPDVASARIERAPPPVAPPAQWPEPVVEESRYADPESLRGTYPAAQDTEADYGHDDYYVDPAAAPEEYAGPVEYAQAAEDYYYDERQPGDYADYGEPTYGEAETGWPASDAPDYDYDSAPETPPAASPSRRLPDLAGKIKPWHAIVAIAALGVVSIGWGVAHRMSGTASHEIALIPPPEGPLKIKPSAETSGGDAPSASGTAVLDRRESAPVRQIVTNQEQAVDTSIPQDVLQIGAGPVEAPHEPPPPSATQPRKVRTVAVRPEAPPAIEPPAPGARATATAMAVAPQPVATPATRPTPKVQPTPAANASAPPAPGGGFAVQFGAAGSEAEARALIKTIGDKYGAMLSGRKLSFKPATVGDKKVFRVRIAGLAKDAAETLCGRVKAGGGACFVAGN
jgi:hypothetical protein